MNKNRNYETPEICICKSDTDIITASVQYGESGAFNLDWLNGAFEQ